MVDGNPDGYRSEDETEYWVVMCEMKEAFVAGVEWHYTRSGELLNAELDLNIRDAAEHAATRWVTKQRLLHKKANQEVRKDDD